MMMYDKSEVLNWLDALCEEAANDPALANRLTAQSPAFGKYFINVSKLHSVNRDAFPHWYPADFQECEHMYANYMQTERTQEAVAKVETLEAKLSTLEEMLQKLIDVQTPKQKKQMEEAAPADDAQPADEDQQPEPATPAANPDAEADETESE